MSSSSSGTADTTGTAGTAGGSRSNIPNTPSYDWRQGWSDEAWHGLAVVGLQSCPAAFA
jgi:hypothetical protein